MIQTTASCPFVPLCERELTGPELTADEQSRLERHLSEGCPVCEERIEANLSGEGPLDDPQAELRRRLDGLLGDAVRDADERLAAGRLSVLAKIQDRVRREDQRGRRIARRRHLRAAFYVVNVAAILLMTVAYVGTAAAARLQRRSAQALATRTEVQALVGALDAWSDDHGGRVPDALPALIEALREDREDRGSPYYVFSEDRLEGGAYRDGFGRPYRLRRDRGRALIYSVGPDGRDDGGRDDDIAAWILLAP